MPEKLGKRLIVSEHKTRKHSRKVDDFSQMTDTIHKFTQVSKAECGLPRYLR